MDAGIGRDTGMAVIGYATGLNLRHSVLPFLDPYSAKAAGHFVDAGLAVMLEWR